VCCFRMLEAVEGELYSLETVDGGLRLLDVLEAMRCVLLCMLEAVNGGLCLLDVLEVREAMRYVLLCMLEAVDGGLSVGGCRTCRRRCAAC